MASSDRSSYINLYSFEDKSDNSYKFEIENKQAKVAVSAAAPLEFDATSYSFVKATGAFDLDSRFASLESATGVAGNAADIAQLQSDLAAEQVARGIRSVIVDDVREIHTRLSNNLTRSPSSVKITV